MLAFAFVVNPCALREPKEAGEHGRNLVLKSAQDKDGGRVKYESVRNRSTVGTFVVNRNIVCTFSKYSACKTIAAF